MRVLYIFEFEYARGGLGRTVEQLIRHIVPLGIEAGVVLPRPCESEKIFADAGARTFTGDSPWTIAARRPFATLLTVLTFRRYLSRVIKEFRPDILQTYHLVGEVLTSSACRTSGVSLPRIFTQQGNVYWYRGISRRCLRWALKTVDACVFISPHGLEDAERLLGVPRQKIRVIPNATDLHLMSASPGLRQQWGVGYDECLFGVVSFLSPGKCQETLIRAAGLLRDRMPEARYAIIGPAINKESMRYEQKLRQLVADMKLEDRVLFTGFCADNRAIMDAVDVLVSTSVHEGFGQTIIEAWACGKPAVAAKAGGPEYTIEHEKSGLVFEPRDSEALAGYLFRLRDPALREKMGQAGYDRLLEHYDSRVMSRRFKELYEEVIAQRARRDTPCAAGQERQPCE